MGNPVYVQSKTRRRKTATELSGVSFNYLPYTPTPTNSPERYYVDLTGAEPVVLNLQQQEDLIDLWRGTQLGM